MSRRFIELVRVFSGSSKSPVLTSVSSNNVEIDAIKKELGVIKSENEDLQNAYEMTQQELDNLRDKARDMEIEGEKKSIVNLFKQINSSEYSILDNIAQAEKQIRDLKIKGWEPSEDTEAFSTTIRLFYNFLKKYGVTPMTEIGTKLQINLRQSELYDYAGSEFKDEKDIKNVQVKAPGWAYQKDIISRPRVQECF